MYLHGFYIREEPDHRPGRGLTWGGGGAVDVLSSVTDWQYFSARFLSLENIVITNI